MLILEQWPRQIAPAAGRDPGLEFSSTEVGPTSRPAFSEFLDHPCQSGVSPRMGRVYSRYPRYCCKSYPAPVGGAGPGTYWAGAADGPWLCRELAAKAPGRKAVSVHGAEMGSETCLLRASSVKGPAGVEGRPTKDALRCVGKSIGILQSAPNPFADGQS